MIQIHQPEVEALIQHRLTAGGFDKIEDVLLQSSRGRTPAESNHLCEAKRPHRT